MSPPTFEDLLLELGKLAVVEYKVASIFLLELAKFLPAFQLNSEDQWGALVYTGFPSPV